MRQEDFVVAQKMLNVVVIKDKYMDKDPAKSSYPSCLYSTLNIAKAAS